MELSRIFIKKPQNFFRFFGLLTFLSFSLAFFFLVGEKLSQPSGSSKIEEPAKAAPSGEIQCSEGQVLMRIPASQSQTGKNWQCVDSDQPQTPKEPDFSDLFCGCSDDYQPVCGKDYRTHQNACAAECVRVTVAYQGECRIFDQEKLPSGCQFCERVCEAGEVFYEDENGCPYCKCRLGQGEW